ncbi:Condensin-2 complex subunit D3 [Rhynchospora pubera]|uniref:Condensin-2 complex subunit D3 n=1 Tax=Rhynchospora pubera TaxID=906938 RepID=A0AAV8F0I8_9POAL|nr:Condensin-2 complex subunit D3 [Rhynchospora pubera]
MDIDMEDLDGDDTNQPLSSLLSELQLLVSVSGGAASSSDPPPLSDSLLSSLYSHVSTSTGPSSLVSRLPTVDLSLSSLLRHLSSSIDSTSVKPSLHASFAYLSLLLSPSAPLVSLFSPLHFLSILRSLRRSLKNQATSSPDSTKQKPKTKAHSKSKPSSKSEQTRQPGDISNLIVKVLGLISDLLTRIQLESYNDTRKSLIDTITEIMGSSHYQALSNSCFRILRIIVSESGHGNRGEATVEILRSLAPLMLLSIKSPVRVGVIGFIGSEIVPLGNEDEGVKKALVFLPRFLANKAPEKAEPRACAVETILDITKVFNGEELLEFIDYVVKLAKGKPKLRLLAVDLILGLLNISKESDSGNSWRVVCLKTLVERCSDTVAGIRARAIGNIAQVFGEMSDRREEIGMEGFSDMVRRRCSDEKAAVRKAALVLITKAMGLIGTVDASLLGVLGSACSDPLVSIRKAALLAISEVFRRFVDGNVTHEWLQAVPPLIVDNETSIRDECENLFLELVLNRICQFTDPRPSGSPTSSDPLFSESLLHLLKGVSDGEVAPFIKKICTSLGKKKKLKPFVATSLQNIITASKFMRHAPEGAWWLLAEVSLYTPQAVDWGFLSHHWKLLGDAGRKEKVCGDDGEMETVLWARDRVSLLNTISNVSMELPSEPAAELALSLLSRIEQFNMHLSEVDAHIKSLRTLCKRKAKTPEEGNGLVLKWSSKLVVKATEALNLFLSEVSETKKQSDFMTPQSGSRTKGTQTKSPSVSAPDIMQQAVTAVFTVGSIVIVSPTVGLQGLIPLLHTIITSESNNEPRLRRLSATTVTFKVVAPSLYVQSWATMAKICIADDKTAKRYIPLFVQELERSDLAALRNNIMVAMADFCVRYTALVDGYIPRITKSLRDPCEVVRRQTFILLSRLLQRDYVKWRGVLFLRFLLSLVDDSKKITHLADFLFSTILKAKAPLLAYNSFIEAIYVLNGYQAQSSSDPANELFAIKGMDERSKSKRMHIYVALLKQMAPEHLLATSAKLCAEILAAACDGLLNIDNATGQAVLQDALQILACKEMRIQANTTSDTAEMDEEPVADGPGAATSAAALALKGRIITQVAKKNLIQMAVPIFIELKRLLESQNSPLTGCLMDCLLSLLKDYKNEIDEILVADKQLQKELLYDMKKYEEAAKAAAKGNKGKNVVEERCKSVLRDVNQCKATPPLSAMSLPKVKGHFTGQSGVGPSRPASVLDSVRRKQSFESDDES